MTAYEQYLDPTVYAQIDATGAVSLTVDGVPSQVQLGGVEEARQLVTRRAWELAVQTGQDVRLDTADPNGAWVFVVRPDGSIGEADPLPYEEQPVPGLVPEPEALPDADDQAPDAAYDDADEVEAADPAQVEAAHVEEVDEAQVDTPQPVAPPVEAGSWDRSPPVAPPPAPRPQWASDPQAPQPPRAPQAPRAPLAPRAPEPPRAPGPQPARHAFAVDAMPEGPQPRRALPTLDDLLESRPTPPPGPATTGWQGLVRRATFGLISPRPGELELRHRGSVATIQRSLAGPRTVVVVNPKGGACKTTATMLLAATFATHRGGYTLAWDNNETRGTLGWRALPSRHTNTAVDLLADLERFQEVRRARVGDLDNYVRSQGAAQFDVLASDEDASASASIDADAFNRLHATLSRFYRILVVDTGNNMRASNWDAAIRAADQLVIVSTLREDTAASAAWLVDGLRSKGFEDKVARAVTILSAPSEQTDTSLTGRLHDHFGQLTRAVVDVPHDPALVAGGTIEISRLAPSTREAWIHATAAVADGL